MYELYGIKKNIKPTLELSLSLIHPDDINSMQKAVEGTLNGDLKQTYGFRILRKDGKIRHAIARSRLFTDENGNPNKVIGTIQDITDQKTAEEKIRELNESLELRVVERTLQLEKANKEIKSLLQEMHHRVKNNLQIVSSLMNLQANTAKDDEVVKVFEESRDRIQSMAFIHENLYMKQSVSEINLKEYIEPLLIARMRSVPGFYRRVLVEMDLLDISFNIDTVLPIGLLVNELVTNSIKHAFPNDKKGKICLCLKKEKVNSYILTYSDDGIGFKEKENNIDTNSLGLVLIESFVMQLDGKMKYNSNKNGTTYTIKFESK
jgi:two-component sensor histidine kinase